MKRFIPIMIGLVILVSILNPPAFAADETGDSFVYGLSDEREMAEALKKEMEKLEKNLGGIKEMDKLPGVIFIVDPKKERTAILEAKKLKIPVVGLVDTNCSPEDIDFPIPGNDDAIRSVKLIATVMANAVIEGKQGEVLSLDDQTETEETSETSKEEAKEEIAE